MTQINEKRILSRAAECAVIASMILNPNCIREVRQQVGVDSFAFLENQILFETICDLWDDDGTVDAVLLRDRLADNGDLDKIGGYTYIAALLETTPSAANAIHYAKDVQQTARRRRIIKASETIKLLTEVDESSASIACQIRDIGESLMVAMNKDGNIIELTQVFDVQPEPIEWLWYNRIPNGALTIVSGDPNVGKSYLTIAIAAIISRGEPFLDCPDVLVKAGGIIFFSDEDDRAKIIRPRLDFHKANLKKVYVGGKVGGKDYFDISKHLGALESALGKMCDCRLIVLDPITAYLGSVNANSNAEVRSVLTPLALLAQKHNVAIIGINHHNKRADLSYMYRGMGSQAFIAQARSAWVVMDDAEDDSRETRIFAPIKANYCIRPTGLKYRIINNVVEFSTDLWCGHVDNNMQVKQERTSTRVDEAVNWLKERLAGGSVTSSTLFDEGSEHGLSKDLLYRAKEKLCIKAAKAGYAGGWYWELKTVEDRKSP